VNLSPGTPRCRRLTVNPDLARIEVRLAGALLRHHREAVRWTVEEAAAELECDASKISRIETGHRKPMPGDMIKLLTAYGVSHRERQDIAALTQGARAGWWGEYRGLIPDGMVDHACWNRSSTT
jgi:transcriptional regulator with XRE-family HTH domain